MGEMYARGVIQGRVRDLVTNLKESFDFEWEYSTLHVELKKNIASERRK